MLTEHKLAVVLSKLEEHPNPKYALEQYSITPGVAAHILFLAKGDIEGKTVYDLGCGTGRLAIGAALLGAGAVFGVDMDPDTRIVAERNAMYAEKVTGLPVARTCKWVHADVFKLDAKADTVIQFPPFELGDVFFRKALEISDTVYSIGKSSEAMESRISWICREHGFDICNVKKFDYKIAWRDGGKVGFEIMLTAAKKSPHS